ncbi:hypothetical protein Rhal01_01503 [Rubritalea halochordaticola]|uniref:TraB/GumN family protein n=1 Tax=Rubritalea halochordaticola TaxID=714537 RepID=A0ABP9UYK4_9BACT
MKLRILSTLLATALPLFAQDTVKKGDEMTDFIRVHHTEKNVFLQTGVTSYSKGDVKVDLIGAVHIADKSYFETLNTTFENYDVVLFEMVGGEQMVDGKMPELAGKDKEAALDFLGTAFLMMEKALSLTGQKDHIDYSKKNFVHADLSVREFQDLQKKKGESIVGFALAQHQNMNEKTQPDSMKLLHAILSGNPDKLKLNLVETLGNGDNQVGQFAGQSVIIGDRNQKCMEVLAKQMTAGKKKIGIFYGAAHFPDMEERLIKQGFKKSGHSWIPAWTIDKEKANAQPKPAEDKKAA